jgi:NADH:ubiquinone oxidoreductase subunit 6 (subunit J)
VVLGLKTSGRLSHEAHVGSLFGGPSQIGRLFLTDHLLAFEITSIVLLVAAVGGVILGSHSREAETQQ